MSTVAIERDALPRITQPGIRHQAPLKLHSFGIQLCQSRNGFGPAGIHTMQLCPTRVRTRGTIDLPDTLNAALKLTCRGAISAALSGPVKNTFNFAVNCPISSKPPRHKRLSYIRAPASRQSIGFGAINGALNRPQRNPLPVADTTRVARAGT